VAGAVALVWSAAPQLRGRIEETAGLLRRTARPLTSDDGCGALASDAVPNAALGWGRLDVGAAVEAERPIARSTPVLPEKAGGRPDRSAETLIRLPVRHSHREDLGKPYSNIVPWSS
jgi:hypothetical protein